MPTVLTHPFVAAALGPFFRNHIPPRWWLLGVACTVVPDSDAFGFFLGVPYAHVLGHRGLTHSIAFALLLAAGLSLALPRWIAGFTGSSAGALFAYCFLCTISHGVLDAMTDGGLGVAFWAPFSSERYFFPWRPIEVSPIAVLGFFNARAVAVLRSEAIWVGLPCAVLCVVGLLALRARRRR